MSRALRSRELLLLLIVAGCLLRVAQYVANRSLWIDESWLALNIIERPLSGLLKPLAFNQGAPPGFLLVEGAVAKLLGFGEYALRLFPLICGLVSIPMFAWLARRMLAQAAAAFAVLLFAVADGLIYYSSEVKPYETDVAVAVTLLAAATLLLDETRSGSRTAFLATVGGIALLPLSFAAVFIVGAVACTLASRLLLAGRAGFRSPAFLATVLWIAAVAAVAAFGATRVERVRQSFEGGNRFLGVIGSSSPLHAANFMGSELATAIGFPQHRPFNNIEKLALLCALLGAVGLLRRNRSHLLMLIVPMALLFVASAIHAYPMTLRTELFLVPAVVLLIAEGVAQLVRWTPLRARTLTALILAFAVGAGPVWLAGERLAHPRTREEIKPVLEFVRDHWQRGDVLYVHAGAQYAFLYYEECKCLRLSLRESHGDLWPLRPLREGTSQVAQAAASLSPAAIVGRYHGGNAAAYVADLNRVRGRRRVWFLYTHVINQQDGALIKNTLLRHMSLLGYTRTNGIDREGAHAYLYQR